MTVEVTFRCGGCDASTEATGPLRRRYEPIRPGSNLCRTVTDAVEDIVPEGWVAYDPYTHCTYCPSCWATIGETP